MQIFNIYNLIGILVGIDIVFFIFILLLLKKHRHFKREATLEKEIETFEMLIKEADRTAAQFNAQLQEKHQTIDKLNDKLDKRIQSLNMLVTRSDVSLSQYASFPAADNAADQGTGSHQGDILKLAENGYSVEDIARKLSVQRGEVTLVLNMK